MLLPSSEECAHHSARLKELRFRSARRDAELKRYFVVRKSFDIMKHQYHPVSRGKTCNRTLYVHASFGLRWITCRVILEQGLRYVPFSLPH